MIDMGYEHVDALSEGDILTSDHAGRIEIIDPDYRQQGPAGVTAAASEKTFEQRYVKVRWLDEGGHTSNISPSKLDRAIDNGVWETKE